MTDIPADIMERAREAAAAIAAEVMGNDHLAHRLDEQQTDEVHGDIQEICAGAIAQALLAAEQRGAEGERARCAAVVPEADIEKPKTPYDDGYMEGFADCLARMRLAIRSGAQ